MSDRPEAGDLELDQQIRLLSGGDYWHTQALPEAGVPRRRLADGPHGLRVQVASSDRIDITESRPATCFPTAVTLGSTWDESLVEEVGRALGREALAEGVGVLLGPGLNIKRHPLAGRNFEHLSEDPLVGGRLAAAMVRGIQSRGVAACPKHFVANNQESHRLVVDAVVDERTLREIYLAGFEEVVRQSRPMAMMAAYNRVNGRPCTEHGRLLNSVLREDWGYEGLVVSDWGATCDRVAGVAAGMDLEMPGSGGAFDATLAGAVRSGELERGAVEACVRRVLGLVEATPGPESSNWPGERHHGLARRAAAAGTVLLTNDGVLPLEEGSSVALIGAFADEPRYQGGGSSRVNPSRLVTAREALEERGVDFEYAAGYDPVRAGRDERRLGRAVEVAERADVAVVMVGLPRSAETEGLDRDHMYLPEQHDALVSAVCEANARTVVALSNGSPVRMPWVERPAAILESYLGGEAGGEALFDVLFGDAEPGGRLAETFPKREGDVAADPWFPGDPHQVEYREGLFVGYRHHATRGREPLFPFGHGLSYTDFAWRNPQVDEESVEAGESVTVRLTVVNTGDRPGSEVVQIYVHDRTDVVLRPRRELRGFEKVHLQPGEAAEVCVELGPRAFAFYDVDRRDWAIPSGPFDIEIARSSADVVETLTVEMTGGVSSSPEPPERPSLAATDEAFRRRLGRAIPEPRPVRPFTRDSTIEEIESHPLGRLVAEVVRRLLPVEDDVRDDPETGRMLERSVAEMPLRGLALLSAGAVGFTTVDALVDVLNGRPDRAVGRVVRSLVPTSGGESGDVDEGGE